MHPQGVLDLEIQKSAAKLALSVSALALAAGSLTACSEESNTAKPGPDNPAITPTPAQEMSTDAPAPTTATPTAKISGAFGDMITFPSGVAVKAAQPVTVTAAPNAAGAVQGKIVTIDVAVTNGSKELINDANMGAPKVIYGAQGTADQNAVDAQAGIGMATFSGIRPGETRTVKPGSGHPSVVEPSRPGPARYRNSCQPGYGQP